MKAMRKLIPLLLIVLTMCKSGSEDKAYAGIEGQEVLDSAVIQQTKDGRKLWRLKAARIEVEDSLTKVYGFEIQFFGNGDSVISVLSADSGFVFSPSNDMVAMGDVSVVNRDGSRLKTDQLKWDSAKEKIYTDREVVITDTTGKVLKGRGLEANPDLTHIKIISEVNAYGSP